MKGFLESLEGRTAVVTGASSGIGRAVAIALAGEGVHLMLLGRSLERLEAVAGEVGVANSGVSVKLVEMDLTQDEALARLPGEVEQFGGRVDILVHSAGTFSMGRFSRMPVSDFDRLYRTNLRAPFVLSQLLLPYLFLVKGQIVFVISTAAFSAGLEWVGYSATKSGLKMLAEGIRAEVDLQGVRVLSVFPGRTATAMQEKIHEIEGRPYRPWDLLQPEDVAEKIVHSLAMKHSAEVTEITIKPLKH